MPELQDHTHLWPARWSRCRFMSLFSFCFNHTIDQECVGHSKIWQNTSYPYSIFTTCNEVKVRAKFFNGSNFHRFYFCMQNTCVNLRKLAPYENFPLYGITIPILISRNLAFIDFLQSSEHERYITRTQHGRSTTQSWRTRELNCHVRITWALKRRALFTKYNTQTT